MARALKRILCIDDDPDILAVIRLCLHQIGGYEVFTYSNGNEASIRMSDIRPDLILLDVMMPGMDGPALAMKLKENAFSRSAPIVFMTARVQPREVEDYVLHGAAAVISKPFNPMTLAEQLTIIWSKQYG